jgi:hypothetical protein
MERSIELVGPAELVERGECTEHIQRAELNALTDGFFRRRSQIASTVDWTHSVHIVESRFIYTYNERFCLSAGFSLLLWSAGILPASSTTSLNFYTQRGVTTE